MMDDERRCILIVDDEPDMLDVTAMLLESCGYRVLTARNGAVALDILRRVRPCVILLDVMMPVMDGYQFRAAQLREPGLADVPVVIFTGAGAAIKSAPAFAEVAAFLEKPVDVDALLRAVAEHC